MAEAIKHVQNWQHRASLPHSGGAPARQFRPRHSSATGGRLEGRRRHRRRSMRRRSLNVRGLMHYQEPNAPAEAAMRQRTPRRTPGDRAQAHRPGGRDDLPRAVVSETAHVARRESRRRGCRGVRANSRASPSTSTACAMCLSAASRRVGASNCMGTSSPDTLPACASRNGPDCPAAVFAAAAYGGDLNVGGGGHHGPG
jgi:hypothetical protein